jgi:hypothetical protein
MTEIRTDMNTLKEEIKAEIIDIKGEMKDMKTEMNTFKEEGNRDNKTFKEDLMDCITVLRSETD